MSRARWVEEAEVRMREEGQRELFARTGDLVEKAKAFDWGVHEMTAMPIELWRMQRAWRVYSSFMIWA